MPGAERLGGIMRAHVSSTTSQYRLPVLTSTFHGRDLFAPAAAHLALGVPLESIGPEIDPADLVADRLAAGRGARRRARARVIYRDTFGNVKLAGVTADLLDALEGLEHGERLDVRLRPRPTRDDAWAQTFGDVPALGFVFFEDSYGRLCIAQSQGNAAEALVSAGRRP